MPDSDGCIHGWCPRGTPDPRAQVPVFVRASYRNTQELESVFAAVSDPENPRYGQHLTEDELYALIGNPQATSAVLEWLRASGLRANVTASRYGVRAVGSVAAAERAFGARYQIFEHASRMHPRTGEPLRLVRSAAHTLPRDIRPFVADIAHVSDGFHAPKVIGNWTAARARAAAKAAAASTSAATNSTLSPDGLDDDGDDDSGGGGGGCVSGSVNYCYGNIRPSTIWSRYNTPCTPACADASWQGHGNSFGVYENENYASQPDLDTFFESYMCSGSGGGAATCDPAPPAPSPTRPRAPTLVVEAGSDADTQCTDGASVCTEASLDVQYIAAVAPGMAALQGFWYSGESHADFAASFADLGEALLGPGAPRVMSVSYGASESELPLSTMSAANQAFQAAGARGVSVLAASCDAGASNYRGGPVTPTYCGYEPCFPASSPYVTAVGATSLSPPAPLTSVINNVVYGATSGGAEIPSSGGNPYGNQVTSGGGFSCKFPMPQWQSQQVARYQATPEGGAPAYFEGGTAGGVDGCAGAAGAVGSSKTFNKGGRAYPDVAALGWQFETTIGGFANPDVAGTSAATPVMAGMLTIINGQRLAAGKTTLGFVNPALYSSKAPVGAFNKVGPGPDDKQTNGCTTTGMGCCSYGFRSTSGGQWDAYRGLGTVNFPALSNYLQGLP